MPHSLLAFIGGTGFDLRGPDSPFQNARDEQIETRFGVAAVTRATLQGRDVVFLHRHARPDDAQFKDVPPHKINYRANIASLKKLGVTGILASTAVGGLRANWPAGTLVLLDQFIDITTAREKTFFDTRAVHIDVTQPYCAHLRDLLLQVARDLNVELQNGGTYLCADGPRFETAAEIKTYAMWGADVVGMTGVPEATLAREAEISYAGISIVTNAAAGISPHALTHMEVMDAMQQALPTVATLFLEAARRYEDNPDAPSRRATRDFAVQGYEPSEEIV
ncbi:5'-methylthioadenosine phosphorylase [Abditibacterium utsteinense]|uniref:Probable 6-oxopurine nucleoside phosphorylase n=1 Tax=Abditibacterium utsteinense TaxID=1960156 RepID=A0A2S8SUP6_9BACT|nr:S-methyl-5'-thioinosine phosphorylase [Abditibacterium utsteinense]PQV64522.1 5'-methylthioadenosine phosphorylase [Abditibacterium utsteinense]